MQDFFRKLFDGEGFVPRAQCGQWTPGLQMLHNVSDGVIWLCYMVIPIILIYLVWKRKDLPFGAMFWMFGGFIVFCGLTHLMDIVLFDKPVYRLAGLVKLITAAFSLATVIALVPLVPTMLALRSPKQLEALNNELAAEVQERKRAEAQLDRTNIELREHENFARSITESASDAIISANASGEIVSWNSGAQRIFGYAPHEIVGKSIVTLIPTRYVDEHREGMERYNRTGEARILGKTLEVEGLRKNGSEFAMELCVDAWGARDRRFFTAISRDVTERRRSIEEVRKLNEELEAFTYSVSHDLRAPLRALDGYSRILIEDHSEHLNTEARRLLGVIVGSARRMGQLIDDLLEFARLGRASIIQSPIDMTELANEALREILATVPERTIDVRVAQLPRARGDRALLKQVLLNLFSNAVKYTGTRARAHVEIGSSAAGSEIDYWVRDDGVGFDMAYHHKLFGVFQRLHADKEFAGTGVGLALVQKIVLRHGGRVWAEGAVGEGATFHFTLMRDAEDMPHGRDGGAA